MLAVLLEIVYSRTLSWMGKGIYKFLQFRIDYKIQQLFCHNDNTLCLFCSLLKIWNLNKLTGVIGVFNCQGAGSWPLKQAAEDVPTTTSAPSSISGHVSPLDVEFLEEIAGENWNGECAVYAINSG